MEAKKIFTVNDLMAAIASNATKLATSEFTEGKWAMSSKFYDQVMEDGHIFNPYLHRRFLPSQFLRMMKNYGFDIDKAINESYSFTYTMEWVKDEVRKLAFLQEADPIAFEERKHFLTIDNIKDIVDCYVCEAAKFINMRTSNYCSVKVGKHEFARRSNVEEYITKLHKFSTSVQSAITYETMNALLQEHYIINVNYGATKSGAFIDAFKKGGAYYTLKHLVMFEHLSLNGKTGAEACTELSSYMNKSAGEIYEALKATINTNNFSLPKMF